jgi:hypothetical protein
METQEELPAGGIRSGQFPFYDVTVAASSGALNHPVNFTLTVN